MKREETMGRPSRFQIMKLKKEEITSILKHENKTFFTYMQISGILDSNRDRWDLPQKTTTPDFIKFLISEQIVSYDEFQFPHKTIHRYTFEKVSIFKMASSLFKGSFLSHHTAALFHNLTSTDIGEIYVNKEQSDKGNNSSEINQSNILKAFSNNMRRSNNYAAFNHKKIFLLNGKYTADLGVEIDLETDIRVTSIPRTLIDITVRPLYCGGPELILEIFQKAKGRFLVKDLAILLEKINYSYPYHQSIGFYLDKANYPIEDVRIFKEMNKEYDFYLTYKMVNPLFDKDWRIYFPKTLN